MFRYFLRYVSLWRTLRANFRLLPFRQAVRLPIFVGPRTELAGLRKGVLRLEGPVRPGMIVWGITPHPRFSNKGLWTLVSFSKHARMTCAGGFILRSGASLTVTGRLTVGRNVLINQRSLIACHQAMTFGDHVSISWDVQIIDSDGHLVYDEATGSVRSPYRPVRLGRNVWIGSRVNIGKGAVVPDYSIVARGSLVTRDFSAVTTRGNVFAGVPATLRATGRLRLFDAGNEHAVLGRLKREGDAPRPPAELGLDLAAMLDPPVSTDFH